MCAYAIVYIDDSVRCVCSVTSHLSLQAEVFDFISCLYYCVALNHTPEYSQLTLLYTGTGMDVATVCSVLAALGDTETTALPDAIVADSAGGCL